MVGVEPGVRVFNIEAGPKAPVPKEKLEDLVDDFTAELDAGRRAFLLDLTSRTPQALVSGTEPPPRADLTLHVDGGEVRRA